MPHMDPINVLVVDDSLVIRGMLTSILEADRNIRVVGAVSTAADADTVIAQHIVDVITLDVEMPGTNGLDYLPSLVRRRIPTIILSSRASDKSEVRDVALSRGASSCFDKANAVRDASILLASIKVAALQRHKPIAAAVAPQASDLLATPDIVIEQLIAEHGDGLTRFIAERIGYAALEEDAPGMAKWLAVGRKLQAVRSRAQAVVQGGNC
jgi:chemotaxis response regulator CheB